MDPAVEYLMAGDPAIRWQTMRDLLDAAPAAFEAERRRVTTEGWGTRLLALQGDDGSWGPQPYGKWTGTFYTLLVVRDFGILAETPRLRKAARLLLEQGHRPRDGGLVYGAGWDVGETCVGGMGLAMLGRYGDDDPRLDALVDCLLREQMPDGGWNCQRRRGATHSSFHTTISVLEGMEEWRRRTGDQRVAVAAGQGREFLLVHQLFRSHRTGAVVSAEMKRLHFPPRWHYDILRALEHFRAAGAARDERLGEAVGLIRAARKPDGLWRNAALYRGTEHFLMEPAGQPSRWNTLRALRALRWWEGV